MSILQVFSTLLNDALTYLPHIFQLSKASFTGKPNLIKILPQRDGFVKYGK